MADAISREELEAAHCWETGDRVPGRPEMTAFRQRVRLHQARWREANGHPIGSQPIVPRPGGKVRPVGSRMPLDYARATGANFVTTAALDAVHARVAFVEPQQSFDHQRVWAELLWSAALSFNLFGDLAADHARADRAVHKWWPDTPGVVSDVRFAHSPGRLDMSYLGNLCAFDVAFVLDLEDGTHGVLGVRTVYYDRTYQQPPKPKRLAHYTHVTEASGAFAPGWLDPVNGTELVHLWLEHALLLSMLQHPSGEWTWGRYVIVHPAGNVDFADASVRYRSLLADTSTFDSLTMEQLLASRALAPASIAALRDRYLPG